MSCHLRHLPEFGCTALCLAIHFVRCRLSLSSFGHKTNNSKLPHLPVLGAENELKVKKPIEISF